MRRTHSEPASPRQSRHLLKAQPRSPWRSPVFRKRYEIIQAAFPRFTQLADQAATPGGIRNILRIRFATELQKLRPRDRAIFLEERVDDYLRLDLDERLSTLFVKETYQGDYVVGTLIDEGGTPLGEVYRRPNPKTVVILKNGIHSTTLSVDLPHKLIRKMVRDFLKSQRPATRQGRKPGTIGVGIDPAHAIMLAYAYEKLRFAKAYLLKHQRRATTSEDYHWLDRRLALGKTLLEKYGTQQFERMLSPLDRDIISLIHDISHLLRELRLRRSPSKG